MEVMICPGTNSHAVWTKIICRVMEAEGGYIYAKRSGTKRGLGEKDPNLGGCDSSEVKLKNLGRPGKRGKAKQVINKNKEKRF